MNAWAAWIGAHPVEAWALGLVAVLLVVGGAWLGLQRLYIRPHRYPDAAAARALVATLAVGWAAILAAGALFALVPGSIASSGRVAHVDQVIGEGLRASVAPELLAAAARVTVLGDTRTLWILAAVVTAVLLVRRERLRALAWAAALAGNGLLTRALKAVFERDWPGRLHDLVTAEGWSFPSGHASSSTVAYGMLAYLVTRVAPRAWHLPIVCIAAAAAYTIGCTRIVLQVHYATDVLAGFALGAAWLGVCVMAAEAIEARRRRA